MEESKPQAEKEQPLETQPEPAQADSPERDGAETQSTQSGQGQPEETPSKVAPPEPDDTPAVINTPSLIVGIGASAGGLEAMSDFFSQMPPRSDMAFVVVMHLEPTYESMLDRILQRYTPMKVSRIQDGMPIRPNQVYVIPQDQDLGVMHGVLYLVRKVQGEERQMVIDGFLRHLAQDQGSRAACLILSGNGSDGSLGLRTIKEKGGLVIVQEPETATYNRMPRSAIETGLADYILPPAQMPEALLSYSQEATLAPDEEIKIDEQTVDGLNKIFLLLRAETGQDFSQYRLNTLLRRITKRMAIHRLDDLEQYAYFLRQNSGEISRLFYEILIGVTQFFREPEAFELFKTKVLPELFKDRSADQPLRIWVPGCSTGEEAYSLAILVHEYRQEVLPALKVDIFATDLNSLVIEKARLGQYPASIMADVPEDYLNRYFIKRDHSYLVRPEIREMLIFAPQSLLKDPPFSKLDLISCRNLLIYLKPETQRKVLALFQYALRPGGFLFLGSSENIGELNDLFAPVDRKWRLFRRTQARAIPLGDADFFSLSTMPVQPMPVLASRDVAGGRGTGDQRHLTERMLLEHYNPVGILVNERCDILYTYGNVDLYLKLVPGEARLNVLDMARIGLELELNTALQQVINQKEVVRRDNIWVKINGGEKLVDLIVKPVSSSQQRDLILIIIQPAAPLLLDDIEQPATLTPPSLEDTRLAQLQKELQATKQHLQSMIEELQAANEEHRSFAEELQSANEELQSTNEELTTSQEELQSVNEELVTANAEIQNKNIELRQANNDLHNLLSGSEIATIFLDTRLNIKRFTPAATRIINLISSDVGRPLKHTVSNLKYEQLNQDIERVLDTLNTQEQEVETEDGRWYAMRILPYRTVENVIDGIVLTFADITPQKRVQAELSRLNDELRATRDYGQAIIDTLPGGVLILDRDLRIISASRSFYQQFQLISEEIQGKPLYELKQINLNMPQLRQRLTETISQEQPVAEYEFTHEIPRLGQRRIRLSARHMLLPNPNETDKILLIIEDVTEQKP